MVKVVTNIKKVVSNGDNNFRYERKFLFQGSNSEDLINLTVFTNSFGFQEIFERRTVNNMYLDDQNMSFYNQNVSGDEEREKYRIRWYGDSFSEINKPTLEIKKKKGSVGNKLSFNFKGFTSSLDSFDALEVKEQLEGEMIKQQKVALASKLYNLKPSLYNSYQRRYFLSRCERFRITIDYDMTFYDPNVKSYKESVVKLTDVVLELKYAIEDDKDCSTLTQEFEVRLFKNSKYVRGVDLGGRRNIKKKILLVLITDEIDTVL